nr:hypothetical protein [Tanacetum cinerariifolium]
FYDNIISLQFQMEECHLLLTDLVDLVNPEGHRVVPNVSKPLPLRGPSGQETDIAHIPKIKTRPDWLKPVPEEDRPKNPKPDWIIPPNDLPKTENN